MSFTATLSAFGSTFDEVLVVVTEAGLEFRLNDDGIVENQFRFQYKVYVSQEAKDAGGEAILNEWEQLEVDETIEITKGNIVALVETKIKALNKFSNNA